MTALTRIDKLKKTAFSGNGFDGYLIFNSINQLYFLGFPGTSALLVPAEGECTVFVYGVNYEQTKAMGRGCRVDLVKADESLIANIAHQAADYKVQKLAVDALGVESWGALTKELPNQTTLEVNNSYLQALRAVKDKQEIQLMRKAGEITSEGMKAAYETIKPGVRQCEVAGAIEHAMRIRGAGPTAFETIVVSGLNSAFPHGECSEDVIKKGDLVVVDIGATYNYYCSDMSRTVVAGKPTKKQQKIYDTVKKAHDKAFQAMKAGVPIANVDKSARSVIEQAGFGEYFVHRLGHGVGLEVHEPPSLNAVSKEKLAAGNVVTDEPGIYIPDFGGVRIEDTVLVRKTGAEKLTVGPYSLNKE